MPRKDECPVSFRVSNEEHKLIAKYAKDDDRSIASFVKLLVLSALKVQVPPNENEKIRLYARLIATMIAKELANEQQPTQ